MVAVFPLFGAASADADLMAGFSDEILTVLSAARVISALVQGGVSDISNASELLPKVARRGCRFAVMGAGFIALVSADTYAPEAQLGQLALVQFVPRRGGSPV